MVGTFLRNVRGGFGETALPQMYESGSVPPNKKAATGEGGRRERGIGRRQIRLNTSEAFWPPNPRLLLNATSTFAERLTLGT